MFAIVTWSLVSLWALVGLLWHLRARAHEPVGTLGLYLAQLSQVVCQNYPHVSPMGAHGPYWALSVVDSDDRCVTTDTK